MTVANEIEQRGKYQKLEFVEFLEFIVRVGDVKYKDKGPLTSRVEAVLDALFNFEGLTRKEPKIEVEYLSESEEELQEDILLATE